MRHLPPVVCAAFLLSACLAADDSCQSTAPCYSAAGIVNAASNKAGQLAPFTWVSLYGTNLAYTSESRSTTESTVGLGGVNVFVNDIPTLVSYVSPTQVNFLLPYEIAGNTMTVRLARDSLSGPLIILPITGSAPALFLLEAGIAVVANPTNPERWTTVTADTPAHPGDIVILYATGLGPTKRPLEDLTIPALEANPIVRRNEFIITLDGNPVDDRLIEYVGAAPLFTGVYQINLRLPEELGNDPEIRIGLVDRLSEIGVRLYVR